ncbi:MAG: hypothetical protein V3R81_09140, partial [Gammaproteobacteria bacterium]
SSNERRCQPNGGAGIVGRFEIRVAESTKWNRTSAIRGKAEVWGDAAIPPRLAKSGCLEKPHKSQFPTSASALLRQDVGGWELPVASIRDSTILKHLVLRFVCILNVYYHKIP